LPNKKYKRDTDGGWWCGSSPLAAAQAMMASFGEAEGTWERDFWPPNGSMRKSHHLPPYWLEDVPTYAASHQKSRHRLVGLSSSAFGALGLPSQACKYDALAH
jgi:hypothetical protein